MAYIFDATKVMQFPALCANTGEPVEENTAFTLPRSYGGVTEYLTIYVPMSKKSQSYSKTAVKIQGWIFISGIFLGLVIGFLAFRADLNPFLVVGIGFGYFLIWGSILNTLYDHLLPKVFPSLYDASHALEMVSDIQDPNTGKTYRGCWLIVRDENWAQLVKAKPVLIIPSVPRANLATYNLANPQQASQLVYFASNQKIPPYPLTGWILGYVKIILLTIIATFILSFLGMLFGVL